MAAATNATHRRAPIAPGDLRGGSRPILAGNSGAVDIQRSSIEASYRHQPGLEPVVVDAADWPLVELPAAEAARYAGTYAEDGQRIEIRALNGRLQLVPPMAMGPIDLIPQGDHAFLMGVVDDGRVTSIYHPEERLVFVFDDDGRVVSYEITGPDGVSGIGERMR